MNKNYQKKIQSIIDSNGVVLFMKGTKESPMCGFSASVVQILLALEVDFLDFNVLDDTDFKEELKEYSNWQTIPQLYVKKEFVGGCDIVLELYKSGEIQNILL